MSGRLLIVVAAMASGACSTLPSSGPTAHQIVNGAKSPRNKIGFRLVTIDAGVVAEVTQETAAMATRPLTLAALASDNENDTVGPGDILQISIFEVGVSLFSTGGQSGLTDPSARAQVLPPVTVDRTGAITLPYAGRLQVAGKTTTEVQGLIEQGLRSISQKPQALVTVDQNISNTVFIFGDVQKPGRIPLTLAHERLVDIVALAGGSAHTAEDTIVRLSRGSNVVEERLGRIVAGQAGDVRLLPGDRIELIKRPRTFLVLGASSKVSQQPFETGDVSLAEAVARAGGPTDSAADPSAIFLFRYDPKGVDAPMTPTVYRLNMLDPSSYFLAQQFLMRDKDVLYIGNAAANQPSKLISIINQLFSPLVTARILTQ